MGRLDDIVARNQRALRRKPGLVGVIQDLVDPTQSPDERRRKLLAWGIVLAFLAAVVITFVILFWPDGRAPGGELKNQNGEVVELSALWKDRRVVVMIYAGYHRFRDQLSELDASLKDFDATVIGISSDSSDRVARLHKQLNLHFDLYSDPSYGVIGNWGSAVLGRGHAVFIVEPGGKISHRWIEAPPSLGEVAAATRSRSD